MKRRTLLKLIFHWSASCVLLSTPSITRAASNIPYGAAAYGHNTYS